MLNEGFLLVKWGLWCELGSQFLNVNNVANVKNVVNGLEPIKITLTTLSILISFITLSLSFL
jgi:hypothetical protein